MPAALVTPVERESYDGHHAEEEGEQDWWQEPDYAGYDSGWAGGYYDDASGGWDHFEIDLYSMLFKLDDNLEPTEIYNGVDFDHQSFVFELQEEDLVEVSPTAWKSRPLKIHPEPVPKNPVSVSSGSALPAADTAAPATPPAALAAGSPRVSALDASPFTTPRRPNLPQFSLDSSAADAGDPTRSPSIGPQTPGSAGSPKIVISNTQLEHLKKKMELLKDLKLKKEAPQKKKEVSITANCPGAHGLTAFKTPEDGWSCSVCSQEHKKSALFYGCRDCDHDACEKCATKPTSNVEAKASVKPTLIAQAKKSENSERRPNEKDASSVDDSSQEPVQAAPKLPPNEKTNKKQRQPTPSPASSEDYSSEEESPPKKSIKAPPQKKVKRKRHRVATSPSSSVDDSSPEHKSTRKVQPPKKKKRKRRAAPSPVRAPRRKHKRRRSEASPDESPGQASRKDSSRQPSPQHRGGGRPQSVGAGLAKAALEAAADSAKRKVNLRPSAGGPARSRGSPEAPRPAQGAASSLRPRQGGNDLLRSVLRANTGHRPGSFSGGVAIGGGALKELPGGATSSWKPSGTREPRDTQKAPRSILGGALQGIASQARGAR